MIFIDNEIYELLSQSTDITNIIGQRIFRGLIPENTPNPVLQFGSSISPKSRFKGGREDKADLILKVYADTDNQCLMVLNQVDKLLEGLQGKNEATGFKIKNCQLIRIFPPEEDVDGSNVRSAHYEIN